MARASGERAPAFTSEELEKLVDRVLPQYTLLYGPPDKQVSTLGACCMGYACVERGGCKKWGDIAACMKRQSAPTRKKIFGVPSPRTSGPWGLPQMEHPLPEKMGGHLPLEQEDSGGSAGDGLPMHHDPPDVQDPGGGVPGVGWALEGITAATSW
ncbi:hypothetical protein NDU88_005378 [Pleurodeles waltl]|uniref:Uncharacterized protein n=1 Tax=Pleurodeles waltl TaxID=8319 RepID=A0AAV7UKV6_PLEWA|nr:hypothetical protein NDU88_005378 [Pleurodeles waltl]